MNENIETHLDFSLLEIMLLKNDIEESEPTEQEIFKLEKELWN